MDLELDALAFDLEYARLALLRDQLEDLRDAEVRENPLKTHVRATFRVMRLSDTVRLQR